LICATNPATWAFINKNKSSHLMPELVMPAERAIFQQLNADPAVNGDHRHYQFWLSSDGTRRAEWITAGVLSGSPGWKQIKAWVVLSDATNATFVDCDYGCFSGQWKFSPTQPIYRMDGPSGVNETAAFSAADLGKVWSGGEAYNQSLLPALDAVKNSNEGSPIFRAYLLCRLVDVMSFQPDAWGLSFCPSVRAHVTQVRRIVGGEIASGDWFVPLKASAWNEKLNQFFAAAKTVSYEKEASGNFALAQAVARDGLHYIGFAGLDGKPVITAGAAPSEIWGYQASGKEPVLISNSAMPLSPLFALAIPRSEYLAKAGVEPSSASFARGLLPLFNTKN
jgi:hypothetical protein